MVEVDGTISFVSASKEDGKTYTRRLPSASTQLYPHFYPTVPSTPHSPRVSRLTTYPFVSLGSQVAEESLPVHCHHLQACPAFARVRSRALGKLTWQKMSSNVGYLQEWCIFLGVHFGWCEEDGTDFSLVLLNGQRILDVL